MCALISLPLCLHHHHHHAAVLYAVIVTSFPRQQEESCHSLRPMIIIGQPQPEPQLFSDRSSSIIPLHPIDTANNSSQLQSFASVFPFFSKSPGEHSLSPVDKWCVFVSVVRDSHSSSSELPLSHLLARLCMYASALLASVLRSQPLAFSAVFELTCSLWLCIYFLSLLRSSAVCLGVLAVTTTTTSTTTAANFHLSQLPN